MRVSILKPKILIRKMVLHFIYLAAMAYKISQNTFGYYSRLCKPFRSNTFCATTISCCIIWVKLLMLMICFQKTLLYAEADPVVSDFEKAKSLYQAASHLSLSEPTRARILFKDAALLFTHLVENDPAIELSILHYNAGVCWQQVEEFGKAIYHYRLAESLGLDSLELSQNLAFAQSMRMDEFDEDSMLQRFKSAMPVDLYCFWLLFLLVSFLMLYLGYRWFCPENRWKNSRLEKWVLSATVVSIVILALSLAISKNTYDAVIVSSEITARKGPSLLYENAFHSSLHSGTEVNILSDKIDNWLHVQLPDNTRAWIPEKAVWIY